MADLSLISSIKLVLFFLTLLVAFSSSLKRARFIVFMRNQGSHSILKLKIEENRGDSRRNFVKFEDNLEKNRGESRRFFLHFQTKSRKIEEIFQSQ